MYTLRGYANLTPALIHEYMFFAYEGSCKTLLLDHALVAEDVRHDPRRFAYSRESFSRYLACLVLTAMNLTSFFVRGFAANVGAYVWASDLPVCLVLGTM